MYGFNLGKNKGLGKGAQNAGNYISRRYGKTIKGINTK